MLDEFHVRAVSRREVEVPAPSDQPQENRTPGAAEVMRSVSGAWRSRDYEALRALLHPQGIWFLVDDHPRFIVGVDQFIEAIATAQQNTVFDFSNDVYEELAEGILLGHCQIRRPIPSPGHGHTVGRYYFLLEVRDGLFARSESFPTEDVAREAFAKGWSSALEPVA
jgi:ketosteroid isomerase-like protein